MDKPSCNFVSLHNYTCYSILRAINKPQDLIERAQALGMKSVAITDYCSLAGIWEASKVAKKIKLIVGCEFNYIEDKTSAISFNNNELKDKPVLNHKKVIFIAKNQIGYKNLLLLNFESEKCKLDKNSKIDKVPLIDWQDITNYHEGLICLTGNVSGIVGKELSDGFFDKAKAEALRFFNLFGDDFAFELQPNNLISNGLEQFAANQGLYRLSQELGVQCIAASNAYYTEKEQAKYQDFLLAMKHHRRYKDRSRLKLDKPNFYLHTDEEIVEFFKRNYGQEFAEKLCENTIKFSNKCEKPTWVKPQNVTKENVLLPEFPVKDQPDYQEFCEWVNDRLEIKEEVKAEDKLYMRYMCESRLLKLPQDKLEIYTARYKEELEVFEPLNFCSYMLITADFLQWGRKNDVRIGPGRGCLTGDALVLTKDGFKQLCQIDVGDKVYTHTGKLREVIKRYAFATPKEELLKLRMENSFGDIKLTKDHKVYAAKQKIDSPKWIKAEDLDIGDYIYVKFPEKNNNSDYSFTFDLGDYCDAKNLTDKHILVHRKLINEFTIRHISKTTGVSFEQVRRLKNNINISATNLEKIVKYLHDNNLTIDSWRTLSKREVVKVNRFIELNDEFLYLLGLWVGDGSLRNKQKNGINYSLNSNEESIIFRVKDFFRKIGFNVCCSVNKNSCLIDIGTTVLSNLFKNIFPFYNNSSSTKHLPAFFRKLSDRQLKIMITGVADADGHETATTESIKTISLQLAKELKECFDYLHIPSGVHTSKASNKNNRNNSKSYYIRYSGITRPLKDNYIYKQGYYSKIFDIQKYRENKVYDITVEKDHSYLTSSGVVHNSIGGSLVGYLLDIHQADPIKYGLIFERFLNIEKGEFPDIDNDFDSVGREKVLNYVTNKYGHNMVAHVSNFVTFTPKNAVTDVISCFEIGGSRTDAFRIAKNITETLPDDAKTIKAAMDSSPLLSEFVAQYPEVKEFSEIYIGLPRSYSTHAAGVVISKYPLNGLVPLRIDDFGNVCLEYEKTKAEENGLIKIDFLGLETLNIIETTNSIIKSLGLLDPADPPDCEKYDKIIYDLISAGDTFGVFQLGESGGTIDLCKKIEPHSLEDLAVINALTRPGVSPDVKRSYIERRFGREEIEIPHPNFERAVKATMGLPIFEECFLFLAHYFCGWNLSQSDKMRKISKLKAKGKHLLAELKENFIKGAMEASNVEEEFVQKIWDEWVVPLSGYAFNKSHAILYSMTSFHTAYLKAYYFAPFMTAKLISDTKSNSPKAKDKVLKGRHCLRKNNVIIKPPDVNLSEAMYKLVSNTELVTGFSALHGVKEPAALEIINKRPFNDFEDFLMKVDASKVRAPVIEALAACGALDCFGLPRKTMFMYAADLRKKLKAFQKKKSSNDKLEYALSDQEWNKGEIRALERHYIGEALSGKKEDSFPSLFTNDNITYIKDFENLPDKFRIICELEIKDLFIFKVKNKESKIYNEEICRMLGEDIKGDQVGIVMFPEQLELFKAKYDLLFEKSKIEKGFGIRLAGTINRFQGEASITTSDIYALMKPVDLPSDYKERKKVEIYSATSKKKMLKKKQEDIEEDLFALLKGE